MNIKIDMTVYVFEKFEEFPNPKELSEIKARIEIALAHGTTLHTIVKMNGAEEIE